MPTFKRVPAAVFDAPPKPVGRQPSPEQLAMVARLRTIRTEIDVLEVRLDPGEQRTTVRQQIARAARTAGMDLYVKPSPTGGFYIALATPSRRPRGRRPKAAA